MSSTNRQQPAAAIRTLSAEELGEASGGMKWTRGTVNPDVIDARGGQGSFLWLHWTYDIAGNVSSIDIR